jgi:hypothetical protein
MSAPRKAVFAYGSLVNPDSAAATLGRAVTPSEPVRLPGWRRRWSVARDNRAVEKTFARPDGSIPAYVVGLTVEPADEGDDGPNGILIEASEDELLRLDVREMRYDRVEVGPFGGFDRVVVYRAKPAHRIPEPPPDAIVIAAYANRVEAAFAALGPDQLRLYRETTGPPPVEVVEADLVRDRIPPGNPRDW